MGGVGGGWAAGGGLWFPLRHKQPCCVFSRQHKQSQSAGQAKAVIGYRLAQHTPLLMPFSDSTGPVVYFHDLTGSRKATCESKLGYLYQHAWCAWTVQGCIALMLGNKLDFSCCANKDSFHTKTVTYGYEIQQSHIASCMLSWKVYT